MALSHDSRAVLRYAAMDLLIALPFTWGFLNLVSSYWRYWDMGTRSANGLVLIVLYAPPMLLAQLSAGAALPFVTARRIRQAWAVPLLNIACMAALVALGFAVEVWRCADLPAARPGSFGGFLLWYLRSWL